MATSGSLNITFFGVLRSLKGDTVQLSVTVWVRVAVFAHWWDATRVREVWDFGIYRIQTNRLLSTYIQRGYRSGQHATFWCFYYDGTLLDNNCWHLSDPGGHDTAYTLQAFTESYDATAVVPVHHFWALSKRRWANTYVSWDNQDGCIVDGQTGCYGGGPVMCGRWLSDTEWQVSENDPC